MSDMLHEQTLDIERLADSARRVIKFAAEEAKALGHEEVNTGHLLLGLVREDGHMRLIADAMRSAVERINPRGTAQGRIPFSPRAKLVIYEALRDALKAGKATIAAEDIQRGLAGEGQGVVGAVCFDLTDQIQAWTDWVSRAAAA